MKPQLRRFKASDFLDSEEVCVAYLAEFEGESEELKQRAERDVEEARKRIAGG